jgi:hypothetical protein
MLTGLANQPIDPIVTDMSTVAVPCITRASAVMNRITTGTATAEDMAFAQAVTNNPDNFRYSNDDCTKYSKDPLSESMSTGQVVLWGLAALFVANEIGFFGKNDLQLFS